MTDGRRSIAMDDIELSITTSQAERRRHFDPAAIEELANSIKTVGLLSPLVVRPINGRMELVAGERRYKAAKLAGLTDIDVTVRELSDEQVLEVQLIENLQREGLHELAEAEGYDQLHELGHSAEEIAEKIGKSKAYVYARMKLLGLCKDARSAFYGGKLNASTALLIARIPSESLQKAAMKEITADDRWNGPMTYRLAFDLIQRDYMMALKDAGFPVEDALLVKKAGPCGLCPKRTGNQPDIFGDVKSGDVCTDPVCFKAKREAHAQREIAKAESEGLKVITGKRAAEILPYGDSVRGGFTALKDHPYQDPKRRTVAQLLGKEFEPVLVKDPRTGALIKVAPEAAVNEALKKAGVRTTVARDPAQAAQDRKRKFESNYRHHLYGLVREKLPEKLGDEDLRTLALRFAEEIWHESQKTLLTLWDTPTKKGEEVRKALARQVNALKGGEIVKFLFDCIFVRELAVPSYSDAKATAITAMAKKLKLNPEKVRAELAKAINVKKPKTIKARKPK
jgi:ParB/RepB/Spo0J family partition protein